MKSPSRRFRKQHPAKSSERFPSHVVRGACGWGAPCCKQRNALRSCWASLVSSTVRSANGASITGETHQHAVTRVLLRAAVLCDACAIEWGGWCVGGGWRTSHAQFTAVRRRSPTHGEYPDVSKPHISNHKHVFIHLIAGVGWPPLPVLE